MSRTHVVLGGGPAGSTLADHLANRGEPVRLVDRKVVTTPGGLRSTAADLAHPEQAVDATRDAAVVYHCVNVPYHLQVDVLPGISRNILDAAVTHEARLVVLDTLYPYGEADGARITEATPWAATSRKGLLRKQLDEMYLSAHETGTARVALGRSADFFGPTVLNSTLGGAFFPEILAGRPGIAFGNIRLPHSYSFMPDVAAGLAALGTTGDGDGRVWHLPTVPAMSTAEVHDIVSDLLGRPIDIDVRPEPTPCGPFDKVFMDEYAEMFYQHRIPQNMDSSAFQQAFGLDPTPLRRALATTLEWYADFLAGARR